MIRHFKTMLFGYVLVFLQGNFILTQTATHQNPAGKVADAARSSINAVCSTDACRRTAKKYLDRIDASTDPCDDFFQYSCGKWIASVPEEVETMDEYEVLAANMAKTKQQLLSSRQDPAFEAEGKAKALYQQCINLENDAQSKPLLDVMAQVMGGWPVLVPSWDPSAFDVFDSLVKAQQYRVEPFFSIEVIPQTDSPRSNMIVVSAPERYTNLMAKEGLTLEIFNETYFQWLLGVTTALAQDSESAPDDAELRKAVGEIAEIEMKKLAALINSIDDIKPSESEFYLALNDTSTLFESNTLRRLGDYISALYVDNPGYLEGTATVHSRDPAYLRHVDMVIKELEEADDESKRQLALYLGAQAILEFDKYLPKNIAGIENPFRINDKVESDVTDEVRCADMVTSLMPLAVGAMWVRDKTQKNAEKQIEQMVRDITFGFLDLLVNVTWMDDLTKIVALGKLSALLYGAGYPDGFSPNTTRIDIEYDSVTLGQSFIESVLAAKKSAALKRLYTIGQYNSRSDALDGVWSVMEMGPNYRPTSNSITIPLAILQPPFYDAGSPQYQNYGGVGFLIAHEVTHAFDDYGADYDDQGFKMNWWSNETSRRYQQALQGMIAQYNGYRMPGGMLDGNRTAGENIADNGGLRAAYRAYNRYIRRLARREPLLSGLETSSPEKLFFISASQIWCNKMSLEDEETWMNTETHAPSKLLVNGAVSNMPEFSQAFGCASNARMNSKAKNIVW